jgi:multidrug efflux pump
MVVSILFSAFLALIADAGPLRHVPQADPQGPSRKEGLRRLVQPQVRQPDAGYSKTVGRHGETLGPDHGRLPRAARRPRLPVRNLPSAFVPNEDQGFLIVDVQGPPEASANRTIDVDRKDRSHFQGRGSGRRTSSPSRASASRAAAPMPH